jgi:hypothetical protein
MMNKQKKKVGRPEIVLTGEQKKKVRDLACICTTQQIADYFGISRTAFFEILRRDEEVSLLYKKGRIQAKGIMGMALFRRGVAGDIAAAIFYMKTQGGWKEPKDEEEIQDKELKITVEIKDHENLDMLTDEDV